MEYVDVLRDGEDYLVNGFLGEWFRGRSLPALFIFRPTYRS